MGYLRAICKHCQRSKLIHAQRLCKPCYRLFSPSARRETEVHGLALSKGYTAEEEWEEKQRRMLWYMVSVARTGHIDYAGLPPPPDGWDEPQPEEAPKFSLSGDGAPRRPVELIQEEDGDEDDLTAPAGHAG